MNKNIVSSILYSIAAICLFIFAYNLTYTIPIYRYLIFSPSQQSIQRRLKNNVKEKTATTHGYIQSALS